ncbi:tetratricopeptide repeat protein [Streptomyces durhamensis]|uniref:tetratricopeptide repeat protein n=1 Tax=Streptomyces durhamensis TaxID=68194 RepID=UPI00056AEAD3|nr:tetratricopeptide repeat protein [Streptomyces durhamensis]
MRDDALVGPVPAWTRQESLAYLAPVTGIMELREAEELAAELADSPPALRLARACLERRQLPLGAYLRRVRKGPKRPNRLVTGIVYRDRATRAVLRAAVPAQVVPVAAALSAMKGELLARPGAYGLMSLLAFLAPARLDLRLLFGHDMDLGFLPPSLRDPDGYATAGAALAEFGLVKIAPDGSELRMHSVVQAAARTLVMRPYWAGAALLVCAEALDAVGLPSDADRLASHAEHAVAHVREMNRLQPLCVRVLRDLGMAAGRRGRTEQAKRLLRDSLEISRSIRRGDRADLAEAYYQYGHALSEDGDPAEGRARIDQAIALATEVRGPDAPQVARYRHTLSAVLRELGEPAAAKAELLAALAIGERRLEAGSPDLAVGRQSLGVFLHEEGDLSGARREMEQALARLLASVGENDHRVTACRSTLSRVLRDLGELEEARNQLAAAVAAGEAIDGPAHPHVVADRSDLERVERELAGNAEEEESAAVEEAPFPPLDPSRLILSADAVSDAAAPVEWTWRLTRADGTVLAEHEVRLDPADASFAAFCDLHAWLRWRTSPDRRRSDELRLMDGLGRWIGAEVLGPVGGILGEDRAEPAVVRVQVPQGAAWLLDRPWELARLGDGVRLAERPVSLVFETAAAATGKTKPSTALRILAVFSLPSDAAALGLRRELMALERIVKEVSDGGRAIELHVLHYGVTRQRLSERLPDPEGWDIVHLAGHGRPGELFTDDGHGRSETVTADEITGMLNPSARRLKLIVLSWCDSGGDATADWDEEEDLEPAPALPIRLASTMSCAVLAMRYPLADEFAVEFTREFYLRLLSGGAVSTAAREAMTGLRRRSDAAGRAWRPLWSATPVLLSAGTADLMPVIPPPGPRPSVPGVSAELPERPQVFVGRAALVGRLAATGPVLLTGMPGIGKSTTALEFAHAYADAYDRVLWCQGAVPATTDGLDERTLIVLDGMDGVWHDERWREHAERTGGPKVVLTSRLVPADPPGNLRIEPVHPLSPADCALLAREVPGVDASLVRGGERHPLLLAGRTGHRALIAAWAEDAASALPQEARILFRFLCSLEDADREAAPVVTSVWEDVWEAFGGQGEAPDVDPVLDALARCGLADVVRDPAVENAVRSVLMHPITVEVGRGLLTGEEYAAVTGVVAAFWWFCIQESRREENSHMAVFYAGRAVPYLLALERPREALEVLSVITGRDMSAETIDAVHAWLAELDELARGTDVEPDVGKLRTDLLVRSRNVSAGAELRTSLESAVEAGDHQAAALAGGHLANVLILMGRAEEALHVAELAEEHARRAGPDPWRRLTAQLQVVQALVAAGRYEDALPRVRRLARRLGKLGEDESGEHDRWHVLEVLLNAGLRAAMKLRRWEEALEFGDGIIVSMARRGAPELEIAQAEYNNAFLLREFGQSTRAREVLRRCQAVFERERALARLAGVRQSLAELEAREGRYTEAAELMRDALRLLYGVRDTLDPEAIRDAHATLAAHLTNGGTIGAEAFHHLLAVSITDRLTGSPRLEETIDRLRWVATRYDDLPASLDDLIEAVDAVPGVRFTALLAVLPGGRTAAEHVLTELRPVVRYAAEALMLDLLEAAGLKVGTIDLDAVPEERGLGGRLVDRFGPLVRGRSLRRGRSG